ncbi:FHA domain-containing protein [Aerolutibacter ruishenii]|uniref:FHA domain-containing protein n=1 Tax=Aerolutibacter ruishenii TaxID=686800 RepID=UPI0011A451DA|nr:FHA domain-containing protein [Lysobacter ruishenii]
MTDPRLRFPHRDHRDLVLTPGVHAVGLDANGRPRPVEAAGDVRVQFCVDRRGIWLQLREGLRGVHVNGRPVRRMAMLRPGDAIFFEGQLLQLLGDEPLPAPPETVGSEGNGHALLRGVGGTHHGRAFAMDRSRVVGRSQESDILIADHDFAERHARLEPHPKGIVLRDMGSETGSTVNGHPVRHALLQVGDQVVFDTAHRFVVEAPMRALAETLPDSALLDQEGLAPVLVNTGRRAALSTSARGSSWLLLAALGLAALLSLLLLFGAR